MPKNSKEDRGKMTVAQAGGRGGKATSEKYGPEFYSNIGHKGGQKVRDLIQKGKKAEGSEE